MLVQAVLKQITQLAGGEAVATVQLSGLGSYETFHDGYAVSHGLDRSLLTPGAAVVVEIADLHHPGSGQVVSVARVSAGAGTIALVQFGATLVSTDGSGNGSAAVAFPNTFGSFSAAPAVALSAPDGLLGGGSLSAAAITHTGFTVNVAGAAVTGGAIAVGWAAKG
ncbi:MAG: hypothetical protein ACHQ5A_13440 [Opitutales bacterium]